MEHYLYCGKTEDINKDHIKLISTRSLHFAAIIWGIYSKAMDHLMVSRVIADCSISSGKCSICSQLKQ